MLTHKIEEAYRCNVPKYIHLPDVPLSVAYYTSIPHVNHNVHVFMLIYRDKKIPFILTTNVDTLYRLRLRSALLRIMGYSHSRCYQGYIQEFLNDHRLPNKDEHFETLCWMLKTHHNLEDVFEANDYDKLYFMVHKDRWFKWYLNDKEYRGDSLLHLDISELGTDLNIRIEQKYNQWVQIAGTSSSVPYNPFDPSDTDPDHAMIAQGLHREWLEQCRQQGHWVSQDGIRYVGPDYYIDRNDIVYQRHITPIQREYGDYFYYEEHDNT